LRTAAAVFFGCRTLEAGTLTEFANIKLNNLLYGVWKSFGMHQVVYQLDIKVGVLHPSYLEQDKNVKGLSLPIEP